jgi:hypothetical protein
MRLSVMPGRMLSVFDGVKVVSMRDVSVMRRLFMVARIVMMGCLGVMVCGLGVMMSRVAVMLCCVL